MKAAQQLRLVLLGFVLGALLAAAPGAAQQITRVPVRPARPRTSRATSCRRHLRNSAARLTATPRADAGCGGDDGGRCLDPAAITAGSQVANRTLRANVDAEAGRLADKVSDQLKALFAQQGWIVSAS